MKKRERLYYSRIPIVDDAGAEILKMPRGEKFVSFIKFKRKLFFLTTKGVYQMKENRQ